MKQRIAPLWRAEDLRNIDLDIIFAVGGDDTTLRAFRIIPCKTPLLSINVGGHRGVLSEASEDTINEDISLILDRRYFCESRLRIQASIDDNMILPPALNDILITRTNLTRTPFFIIKMMDDVDKTKNGWHHDFNSHRINRALPFYWRSNPA